MKKHYIFDMDMTLLDTSSLWVYLTTRQGKEVFSKLDKLTSKEFHPQLLNSVSELNKYHKVSILSNAPHNYVKKVLGAHGLNNVQFRGGANKPDNSILEGLIGSTRIARENTIMIGDSATDILAAHESGIASVAVTWGYSSKQQLEKSEPNMIVDSPRDLIEMLGELDLEYQNREAPFKYKMLRNDISNPGMEMFFVGNYYPRTWRGHSNDVVCYKSAKNFTPQEIDAKVKKKFYHNGICEEKAKIYIMRDLLKKSLDTIGTMNLRGKTQFLAAPNSCPEYCYKTDVNKIMTRWFSSRVNSVNSSERVFSRVNPTKKSHQGIRNSADDHFYSIGTELGLRDVNNVVIFDDVYTTGTQTNVLGKMVRQLGHNGNLYVLTLGKTV